MNNPATLAVKAQLTRCARPPRLALLELLPRLHLVKAHTRLQKLTLHLTQQQAQLLVLPLMKVWLHPACRLLQYLLAAASQQCLQLHLTALPCCW
jgi:hypothetical protein